MIIKFRNFSKCSFVILLLLTQGVRAKVHEYETPRLKSTAGAGVGSILMNESVLLNPAPLALFNVTTATIQRDEISLEDRNPSRGSHPNSFDKKTNNNGFFLGEGSSKVKGAVAYLDQKEGKDSRQRYSTAIGVPVNDTLSMGVSYRFTKELSYADNGANKFNYHTFNAGVTKVIDQTLSFGLMVEDPAKSKASRTRGVVGAQYIIRDLVTFIVDVGSNYQKDLADGLIVRGATQIKLVSDFYFRAGMFEDKLGKESGNGWGLGWVGPKLVLEFGMKNTKPKTDPSPQLLNGEKLKEMALSLSYIFDNT